jgi:hypothetical protein
MKEKLTEDNFLLYCAKYYDNSLLHNTEEFLEDLDRLKYIKKLLTRYVETGELKERLILNHIITLHNVFGIHLAKILYLKLKKYFSYVKPFLVLINALPLHIYNVNDELVIHTDTITMDNGIIKALRLIVNDQKK